MIVASVSCPLFPCFVELVLRGWYVWDDACEIPFSRPCVPWYMAFRISLYMLAELVKLTFTHAVKRDRKLSIWLMVKKPRIRFEYISKIGSNQSSRTHAHTEYDRAY